jgi:NhaC family Na+:H+ antiporter
MNTHTEMKDAIVSLLLIMGCILLAAILQIPLFTGFGVAFLLVATLLYYRKFTIKFMVDASIEGAKRVKQLFIILLFIATLIPIWMLSGTIPSMIHYLTMVIQPDWIVLFAFLLTAVTSYLLGTSIGTLSSLGVVVLGVAMAANVSIPLVAGALISGAFFGDRCSPVSSMFNLVTNSLEIKTSDLSKSMYVSTYLTFFLCLIIYFILSLTTASSATIGANPYSDLLVENYKITFITLIPIIVLFASILLKIPIIRALALGTSTGAILALFYQGVPFQVLWRGMIEGHTMAPEGLETILHGGGLTQMVPVFFFITFAGMMNGLLGKTEVFHSVILVLFKKSLSITSYTWRTICIAIMLAVVGCNQAFPIILTAQTLRKKWMDEGFDKHQLGRVICDSGLVSCGIIPWNMVAVLCVAAIGIPTLVYAPYAFLLWLTPFVSIGYSYVLSMKKLLPQDLYMEDNNGVSQ